MNPEWVEAVEKAMDSSLSPEFQWWESSEERITFILGVAEPLVRADERAAIIHFGATLNDSQSITVE